MANFVGQPQQTFGVADQQIAAGSKTAIELFNQPSLLRLIEIHHYVAAENYVIALRQKFRLQIMEIEVDQLLHRFFHRIAFAYFVEIAQSVVVIHGGHLMFAVNAFLPGAQH